MPSLTKKEMTAIKHLIDILAKQEKEDTMGVILKLGAFHFLADTASVAKLAKKIDAFEGDVEKNIAKRLLGLKLFNAKSFMDREGKTLRVIIEDGKNIPVTAEFDRNRFNVEVRDGVVIKSLGLG